MVETLLKRQLKDIPSDWELVKIEDIGTTYGGLTNKSKEDFGKGKPFIPFLNIINNAKIDINDLDYVDIHDDEKQNKALKGDVFFNTSSETPEEVGMSSVLNDVLPELYLNSFCFGFRLKDQISFNPLYLSYFFRSSFGRKVVFPLAQGMTRYNLSKRYFLQLKIPKPKPEEQQKIILILTTVDDAIEKTETIIEETKQLKKGLMQKLFTEGVRHTLFKETKIGRIPEEWEVLRIDDIADVQSGFAFKSELLLDENSKYQVIRIGNLYGGILDLNRSPVYLSKIDEKQSRFLLKKDDLIMTMTGTIGKRDYGYVVMITEQKNLLLNQRVGRLIPNKEIINPTFLFYQSQTKKYLDRFFNSARGGTGNQINSGVKDIRRLPIAIPPMKEQHNIANVLLEVDSKIEKEKATKEQLKKLKKGLMQVLLTGKIRVKI